MLAARSQLSASLPPAWSQGLGQDVSVHFSTASGSIPPTATALMYLGMDAPLSPAAVQQMRVYEVIICHFGFGFVAFPANEVLLKFSLGPIFTNCSC